MSESLFEFVRQALTQDYDLGACQISALDSNINVSNQHFLVKSDKGSFVAKTMISPESLYGAGGLDRILFVSKLIGFLANSNIPVEQIILNNKQKEYSLADTTVVRLYEYIPNIKFPGPELIAQKVPTLLARFHENAINSAPKDLLSELENLKLFMPLEETGDYYSNSLRWLRDTKSEFELTDNTLNELDKIEIDKFLTPPGADIKCLIHSDAHPDNFLFDGENFHLIDLDNIMFESPYRCFAFSALRFLSKNGLLDNCMAAKFLPVWLANYNAASTSKLKLDEVVLWMQRIEIEKISRILYRSSRTGGYKQFIANIAGRHLPNIARIEQLTEIA